MNENKQIIKYSPYSVLMSVYYKEKSEFLRLSLDSMLNQTVAPDEIVIVEDGPLNTELYAVIDEYTEKLGDKFVRIKNEKNLGLGLSLNKGLESCKNEFIARMDTDDISTLDRCEKQLLYFTEHSDVDVVGSNIAEFTDFPDKIVSVRNVPENDLDIKQYLKKRCPMNHVSVMFKKTAIQAVGGYKDWHFNEDYYLWIRMFLNNAKFGNVNENLVFVRIGEDMFARRGGYKYYKSERDLFKFMKTNKIIGGWVYLKAKIVRFILYVLTPNKMRQWMYRKFARQK